MDRQLLTLRQQISSTPVVSGILDARAFSFLQCFVDHSVVCPSSMYGFGIFKLFFSFLNITYYTSPPEELISCIFDQFKKYYSDYFTCRPSWSLVEHELLDIPWHWRSSPIFSGIYVAQSLVFCSVFWSIYGF